MATVSPVYDEPGMSIGRVFQRAFSAISLNPVVILGLAFVVGALPSLVMTYLFAKLGLGTPSALRPGGLSPLGVMSAIMISSFIMFVISALVQGAMTRVTVSANEGVRVSFLESLSAATRVVLPLVGLSIVWAFGVGLGFMLLVIPGLMLLVAWGVAVPSLVVERHGVFEAFRRSAQLTKGARWKIFGLFLVLLVASWLLSVLIGIVGLGMYKPAAGTPFSIPNVIGSMIVGIVSNALWGTIQPSLYVELREWKEGGSLENLEEVFA